MLKTRDSIERNTPVLLTKPDDTEEQTKFHRGVPIDCNYCISEQHSAV